MCSREFLWNNQCPCGRWKNNYADSCPLTYCYRTRVIVKIVLKRYESKLRIVDGKRRGPTICSRSHHNPAVRILSREMGSKVFEKPLYIFTRSSTWGISRKVLVDAKGGAKLYYLPSFFMYVLCGKGILE
jgi:hypothetical protein